MPTSVRPISPAKAVEARDKAIPKAVIACWNTLISENLRDGFAAIKQDVAVKAILKAMRLPSRSHQRVFDEGWLEIESVFRKAGWKVRYDQPGYDESYDVVYEFTAKKTR